LGCNHKTVAILINSVRHCILIGKNGRIQCQSGGYSKADFRKLIVESHGSRRISLRRHKRKTPPKRARSGGEMVSGVG
jgi:hypothetical protein